jgi:hypothetical protein
MKISGRKAAPTQKSVTATTGYGPSKAYSDDWTCRAPVAKAGGRSSGSSSATQAQAQPPVQKEYECVHCGHTVRLKEANSTHLNMHTVLDCPAAPASVRLQLVRTTGSHKIVQKAKGMPWYKQAVMDEEEENCTERSQTKKKAERRVTPPPTSSSSDSSVTPSNVTSGSRAPPTRAEQTGGDPPQPMPQKKKKKKAHSASTTPLLAAVGSAAAAATAVAAVVDPDHVQRINASLLGALNQFDVPLDMVDSPRFRDFVICLNRDYAPYVASALSLMRTKKDEAAAAPALAALAAAAATAASDRGDARGPNKRARASDDDHGKAEPPVNEEVRRDSDNESSIDHSKVGYV